MGDVTGEICKIIWNKILHNYISKDEKGWLVSLWLQYSYCIKWPIKATVKNNMCAIQEIMTMLSGTYPPVHTSEVSSGLFLSNLGGKNDFWDWLCRVELKKVLSAVTSKKWNLKNSIFQTCLSQNKHSAFKCLFSSCSKKYQLYRFLLSIILHHILSVSPQGAPLATLRTLYSIGTNLLCPDIQGHTSASITTLPSHDRF